MKTLNFISLFAIGVMAISGCLEAVQINNASQEDTNPTSLVDVVLTVTPTSVEFASSDADSRTVSFTVSNAVEGSSVNASSDQSWLTATVSDASASSGIITLEVTENTDTEARTATVTVSYEGAESVSVTVTQAGTIPAPVLTVSPTSVGFTSYESGSQTVSFTVTNAVEGRSVSVSSNQSWLTTTVSNESAESGSINLSIGENTSTEAREATVTVSYEGAEDLTITVTQPGRPILSVATNELEVSASGGTRSISFIVSNAVTGRSASASSDQSWLTATVSAGSIRLSIEENTTSMEARTATVTLSYEGAESVNVTVTQAAAEVPIITVSYGSYTFYSYTDNVLSASNGSLTFSLTINVYNPIDGYEVTGYYSSNDVAIFYNWKQVSSTMWTVDGLLSTNESGVERTCTLKFSYEGAEDVYITIRQAG